MQGHTLSLILLKLMPRDWNPNAPNLKKAFTQAQKQEPARRPASIVELTKLQKERKPPAPQLNMNMRGPIPSAARSQADESRETRISEIKQQLAQRRNQAREGFKRAR